METLVTEGTKVLLSYGVLGLAVFALSAIAWLQRTENIKCRGEHLADVRAFGEIVAADTVAKTEANSLNAARTRALEASAAEQALAVAEQKRLTEEVERLRIINEELKKEIASLRETLLRRG